MLLKPIASYWQSIQRSLFPGFATELGPTTDKHLEIILVLDMVEIERLVAWQSPLPVRQGRPAADRTALSRAFVAKATLNLATTRALIDRLKVDSALRRLCGFEGKLPSESTFSNAFREFSADNLAGCVHEALIKKHYQDRLVGHVSRDSTAIDGREKCPPSEPKAVKVKRPRGRPKGAKSTVDPKPESRLERHTKLTLVEMLDDLPKTCNRGAKKNSQGFGESWVGYKLHIDSGDGGIPLSCILTSASLHDSQAAVALETMTGQRVKSLYSLMDSAYDSAVIRQFVEAQGKVSIIDPLPRANKDVAPLCRAKACRYKIRTTIERVNSGLKDDFGGRQVRVKGHSKVYAHLMFGILAMSAMRIISTFS